jgi:hypothetical protein
MRRTEALQGARMIKFRSDSSVTNPANSTRSTLQRSSVGVPADATPDPTSPTPFLTRVYGNPNAAITSGQAGVDNTFTGLSSVEFRSGDWPFVGDCRLASLEAHATIEFVGDFSILQARPSDLGGGGSWSNTGNVTIALLLLGPQTPSLVAVSGRFTLS